MRDDRIPNDAGKIRGLKPTPPPPVANHDHCLARRAGFGDYVVCLEPPPHYCGYALHMGDEYLCLHPHHGEFAAESEKLSAPDL
jgi:hypothetical protein